MADAFGNDKECSDDTFVENSCEGTETESETEEEPWPVDDEGCVHQTPVVDPTCTGEEHLGVPLPASKNTGAQVTGKKRKQDNAGIKCTKKSKQGRNTTRASKIQCLDIAEIREFVICPPPCCNNKCLQKLKIFKDRAVKVVNDIRVARFHGSLTFILPRCSIN